MSFLFQHSTPKLLIGNTCAWPEDDMPTLEAEDGEEEERRNIGEWEGKDGWIMIQRVSRRIEGELGKEWEGRCGGSG